MADQQFQAGSILVEDGTALPGVMALQRSEFADHWKSFPDLDRAGIETQLSKSGWTFFYMAGIVQRHAFGFDEKKRTRTAIGRVLSDVQSQHCNCVEFTHLVSKTFLGIPYVSVTAHARHIQDGSEFHGR